MALTILFSVFSPHFERSFFRKFYLDTINIASIFWSIFCYSESTREILHHIWFYFLVLRRGYSMEPFQIHKMAEAPVTADKSFKTIVVFSTPVSTKTSDWGYIFTVVITIEVLAVEGILKRHFHSLNASNVFHLHYTEKFENLTISAHFRFVFEENSGRGPSSLLPSSREDLGNEVGEQHDPGNEVVFRPHFKTQSRRFQISSKTSVFVTD